MPWVADDAPKFNKKTVRSLHLRQTWADAANKALREYGDEGRAIRIANAAVSRAAKGDKVDEARTSNA
jgi:hypothetical protein